MINGVKNYQTLLSIAENSAEDEELRATRFRWFYRLAVHALPHLLNNEVRNGVNKHEETCCQTQSKHNEQARSDRCMICHAVVIIRRRMLEFLICPFFKFVAVGFHLQSMRSTVTDRSVNSTPLTGIFLTHFTHVFTPHCGSRDSRLSVS